MLHQAFEHQNFILRNFLKKKKLTLREPKIEWKKIGTLPIPITLNYHCFFLFRLFVLWVFYFNLMFQRNVYKPTDYSEFHDRKQGKDEQ